MAEASLAGIAGLLRLKMRIFNKTKLQYEDFSGILLSPEMRISSLSPVMWVEKMSQQLRLPTRSVAGWLVSKFFKINNRIVEEKAVLHCGIQPGDTVLELGHGPGLGLCFAAKMLTGPRGHLIGVDYSEYMHQVKFFYDLLIILL